MEFSTITALLLAPLAMLHAVELEPTSQTLAFPGAEGHGAYTKGGVMAVFVD